MFGDYIFIFVFLLCFALIVRILVLLVKRNHKKVRATLETLIMIIAGYLVVLILISVSSPQRILKLGETLRFDHWGIAVEKVDLFSYSVGNLEQEKKLVLTFRVSNNAKRANQRTRDIEVGVYDADWRRFQMSAPGQKAYVVAHGPQPGFDTELAPETSFLTTRVFSLPTTGQELRITVSHGLWPGRLIIGSEVGLFHKPTYIRLLKP